eukprot:jgi/Psemu1/56958/gm1.56958_g
MAGSVYVTQGNLWIYLLFLLIFSPLTFAAPDVSTQLTSPNSLEGGSPGGHRVSDFGRNTGTRTQRCERLGWSDVERRGWFQSQPTSDRNPHPIPWIKGRKGSKAATSPAGPTAPTPSRGSHRREWFQSPPTSFGIECTTMCLSGGERFHDQSTSYRIPRSNPIP